MTAQILIVDDSASIRLTVNAALSAAGFQVTEASDGIQGLAAADRAKFDLVVTDLNMPIMDGLTMIVKMRATSHLAGIPIIFLTTESDEGLKSRAKSAGATGWLTKPFDPTSLVKIVHKVLGR